MTLDMRRLMAADAEALRALRVEAFTAHPREFRSTPEDEAARPLAELAANLARDQVLGLFDGETLVGVAGLAIEPRAKLAHKAMIWGVYVQPAVRGLGLAKRLLQAAIDRARTVEGLERIQLGVGIQTAPARALYGAAGFEVYGVERHALRLGPGRYVDEELRVLDLRGA